MNVVMYSRDNCTYCVQAKILLERIKASVSEIKVTAETRDDLINTVREATATEANPNGVEAKTLPQIFIDGVYVGGFKELQAKLK